jgi:hypothetical protein
MKTKATPEKIAAGDHQPRTSRITRVKSAARMTPWASDILPSVDQTEFAQARDHLVGRFLGGA